MADIAQWVGREQVAEAPAEGWPIRGLAALLGAPELAEGPAMPPLAHWCWFPPQVPQSKLGRDGHPQPGDFLPALPQPRRMWAGSDIVFHAPIRLGAALTKTARIGAVTERSGRSGALVFVSVENRIAADGAPALEETQTLVYRDDPQPGEMPPAPKAAPSDAMWSTPFAADPALLFRFSAVTFNAHRIHYDLPYARDVEGYPGIVVHGQLTATLLLHTALGATGGTPTRFSFRAAKPIFAGDAVRLEGAPDETAGTYRLWAKDADGALAMTASLSVAR